MLQIGLAHQDSFFTVGTGQTIAKSFQPLHRRGEEMLLA